VSEELSHFLDEFHCFTVLLSRHIHSVINTNSQIFSHKSFLDTLDNTGLKSMAEAFEFFVLVEFGSIQKSSCPSEDTGDRVS